MAGATEPGRAVDWARATPPKAVVANKAPNTARVMCPCFIRLSPVRLATAPFGRRRRVWTQSPLQRASQLALREYEQ
ncbi:hypothetical protein GCM10010983_04850 [Caulobacter rhizosphaerae]|nr:hypothetical protein GCM10010983_04850 [Caulobacter rhizosphaerae]